jgi:uncharacterized membrane protein
VVQEQSAEVVGWRRDLVLVLDRQIYRLARHWLAVFNVLTGLYGPACHQLPERSFFLFGSQPSYTLDELWAMGAVDRADGLLARQRFLGTDQIGWKMAICQRDIAMYGALFVGGLLFGLLRKYVRPLSLLGYVLCLVPMFIDGSTQLVGLRESTALLRVLTGSLVGFATVWMLYPRLDNAFAEVREQANQRVHLE